MKSLVSTSINVNPMNKQITFYILSKIYLRMKIEVIIIIYKQKLLNTTCTDLWLIVRINSKSSYLLYYLKISKF